MDGVPTAATPPRRRCNTRCARPRPCSTGRAFLTSTPPSARSRKSPVAFSTVPVWSVACDREFFTHGSVKRIALARQDGGMAVLYSMHGRRSAVRSFLALAAGDLREPDDALREQLIQDR